MSLLCIQTPTPSFRALVLLLKIDADFLAYPLWAPTFPFFVVIAFAVRDIFRRSLRVSVVAELLAIFASRRVLLPAVVLLFAGCAFASPPPRRWGWRPRR